MARTLEAFRAALIALVPIVGQLEIPWQDGQAYDEWDRIAKALYDSLVVDTLRLGLGIYADRPFAHYDMLPLPNQADAKWEIEILTNCDTDNHAGLLHRFTTTIDAFDTLVVRSATNYDGSVGNEIINVRDVSYGLWTWDASAPIRVQW